MTPIGDRAQYEQICSDILQAVDYIATKNPEAAQYLREHLAFDTEKMTMVYTGDDRISLQKLLSEP